MSGTGSGTHGAPPWPSGAHLDRFAASVARLRLDPGHDRAGIEAIVHGCVRHAGLRAAYVSMTCTRGRMPPGSRDLRTVRKIFYCYAMPFIWVSRPEQQEQGARMRVSEVTRIPPQSVDPSVKNYHWLDLALLDADDHDADPGRAAARWPASPGAR